MVLLGAASWVASSSEVDVGDAKMRSRLAEPVRRPTVPSVRDPAWMRNPIDAFIAAQHETRGLRPRPEARRDVLLRRVYLDLIGLNPTPAEQRAFAEDTSPRAYETVVDRLLEDPRHGERWGRHWMDVWRYSDWAGWSGGNQIRDSQPHIWRWRDWIVESLNEDKGYDRMILEMLAADELAPEDPEALRATGFLVRNYKKLSREQWLEDTVKHTAQAFLGLTMGCAKCHDHLFDPVSQEEYYRMRAIFEPHQVRTDRLPGELNTDKRGLVRVYDRDADAPTYFFNRGDERQPDTNRVMSPGIPSFLGGGLAVAPVPLPDAASRPDRRAFVVQDTLAASERERDEAGTALSELTASRDASPDAVEEARRRWRLAEARHAALLAVLRVERLEERGWKDTPTWSIAARAAVERQRRAAVAEKGLALQLATSNAENARRRLEAAEQSLTESERAARAEDAVETDLIRKNQAAARQKERDEAARQWEKAREERTKAEKQLAEAENARRGEPGTAYEPRPQQTFPDESTGRRLALARWMTDPRNPRAARVAVNHLWLRHFGRGLVPSPADFGPNGRPPTHPELLDWLAAEFMARGWSMKAIHRLIVTSRAYRLASTPDPANAALDPDNVYGWRAPSRRMEAELVRDNILYVSGDLDPAMGGPEIDHEKGLTSRRRSLYLRLAAEKEVEFLKIFDGPSVTECYMRHPTVVPQQALAMANSAMTARQARRLASTLTDQAGDDDARFVSLAYERILARAAQAEESDLCRAFLREQSARASPQRARENLVLVLFNHNDFVTIR